MFTKDLVLLFITSDKAGSHCISFEYGFLWATESTNVYHIFWIPKKIMHE